MCAGVSRQPLFGAYSAGVTRRGLAHIVLCTVGRSAGRRGGGSTHESNASFLVSSCPQCAGRESERVADRAPGARWRGRRYGGRRPAVGRDAEIRTAVRRVSEVVLGLGARADPLLCLPAAVPGCADELQSSPGLGEWAWPRPRPRGIPSTCPDALDPVSRGHRRREPRRSTTPPCRRCWTGCSRCTSNDSGCSGRTPRRSRQSCRYGTRPRSCRGSSNCCG